MTHVAVVLNGGDDRVRYLDGKMKEHVLCVYLGLRELGFDHILKWVLIEFCRVMF